MANSQKNWQGKTGGGKLGQKGLLLVFRFFPLSVIYGVMGFVILFYLAFAGKTRNAIFYYFRNRQGFSVWKSLIFTYKNHFYFGQVVLDRFAIYAKKNNYFSVEIDGNETFLHSLESQKGGIMLSAHVGNYELFGYLLKQDKKKINALIYSGESDIISKERKKIFEKNNINPISVSNDMSHLFEIKNALQNGDFLSLLADRSFEGGKSTMSNFLGKNARFSIAPFLIAEQFDVPIIAVFAMKSSRRKFSVFVKSIACDSNIKGKENRAEALLNCYLIELENIVKKYPDQWFNYYNFWND